MFNVSDFGTGWGRKLSRYRNGLSIAPLKNSQPDISSALPCLSPKSFRYCGRLFFGHVYRYARQRPSVRSTRWLGGFPCILCPRSFGHYGKAKRKKPFSMGAGSRLDLFKRGSSSWPGIFPYRPDDEAFFN